MNGYYFLVISYFLGSLPFSYWIVKATTGEDLREHFSKNAGATNASRVLKKFLSAEQQFKAKFLHKLIFIMDVLKGSAAVILMNQYSLTPHEPWPVLAGIMAVVGHTFPLFLGFRGGKGVATCLGLIFGLMPEVALITFGVWAVVTVTSKFVSLGSIVASIALHISIYFYEGAHYFKDNPLTEGFLVMLTCFIIYKHRSNIKRVIAGTEPKIGEQST